MAEKHCEDFCTICDKITLHTENTAVMKNGKVMDYVKCCTCGATKVKGK